MKQSYEMKGAGHSARAIARELGLARNTALRYLKTPEAIRPKARPRRGSKLHAYAEHIDRPMGESLENCAVLLRELRELGQVPAFGNVRWLPRRLGKGPTGETRAIAVNNSAASVGARRHLHTVDRQSHNTFTISS